MAKKKRVTQSRAKSKEQRTKTKKNEKKKNSPRSIPKKEVKRNSGKKEKGKRRGRVKPIATPTNRRGKIQKGYTKAVVKKKFSAIRDYKGRFIEKKFIEQLQKFKTELIRDKKSIYGVRVTTKTPISLITKAIYENQLFSLTERSRVSYFDVMGAIVKDVYPLKDGELLFVKVKPFFLDEFKVFSIKRENVVISEKRGAFYSEGIRMNPKLAALVQSHTDVIQQVIDEFPFKIPSPLFQIYESRYENTFTGKTFALEYDYNTIDTNGISRQQFFNFLKAILGKEYEQIAALRVRENLSRFSDDE